MSPTVGFDTKELTRKPEAADRDKEQGFFSALGVGIEVFSISHFKRAYGQAVSFASKEMGIERRRKVVKHFYLCHLMGIEGAAEFSRYFVDKIRKHLLNVYVYFTIIPPSKVPKIFMYPMERDRGAKNAKDFLRSLTPGYVHLCAWKYWKEKKHPPVTILMDHFQWQRTLAWADLWYARPFIYFRGDTCNPLIATADIIGGLIDHELGGSKIGNDTINAIIDGLHLRGEGIFIGQPDFRWIVPLDRGMIDCTRRLKHPIYFITTETRPGSLTYEEAKNQLEFSPIYDKVSDAACEADGSIKFYDITQDYKILGEVDKVIYYGRKGEEIARNLEAQYGSVALDARYDTIK